MNKKYNLIVIGSGLFGATVAEQASRAGYTVAVIEARHHIGGNCYTKEDKETGIHMHMYGPHIFHTDNKMVWDYISQFTEFNNYRHMAKSCIGDDVYPIPINLETINKFFKTKMNPSQAKVFIDALKVKIDNPQNFEEQALTMLGKDLYEAFFKGYTLKQWETDPKELPASVARRLPIRTDYKTGYYANNDTYQGIPVDGFTVIFERMLTHENIDVFLDTTWESIKNKLPKDQLVVYTGAIDKFYEYKLGELAWRTLDFEHRTEHTEDYQGVSAMNYPEEIVPWTRIIEHKHFQPERKCKAPKTVISAEFSRAATRNDTPYYPVKTERDLKLFDQYRELADAEPNVIFGGRLGEYMYYDMHQVIASALSCYRNKIKPRLSNDLLG